MEVQAAAAAVGVHAGSCVSTILPGRAGSALWAAVPGGSPAAGAGTALVLSARQGRILSSRPVPPS